AKLCTSRLHMPAPRNSTGTSAAGTWRNGRLRLARAPHNATCAPSALVTRKLLSRPTYAKSVGPQNTDCRPAKSNSSSPHITLAAPDNGTTSISSSSQHRSTDSPAPSSTIHRLDSAQPADSGVTVTLNGWVPVDPAGRECLVAVRSGIDLLRT